MMSDSQNEHVGATIFVWGMLLIAAGELAFILYEALT